MDNTNCEIAKIYKILGTGSEPSFAESFPQILINTEVDPINHTASNKTEHESSPEIGLVPELALQHLADALPARLQVGLNGVQRVRVELVHDP